MDRYIGLDAHASGCTVAVIGPSGRRLQSQVLETNAKVLIDFLKTIPTALHLCLEEGTHSHWLLRGAEAWFCRTGSRTSGPSGPMPAWPS